VSFGNLSTSVQYPKIRRIGILVSKSQIIKIFRILGIEPMYNKFRNWLLNFTVVYKNEFLIFSIRFRLKTRYIGAINLIETQS